MASVDLCNLPIELVCRVLATLELLDLVHCTQVSKWLRQVIKNSSRLQYTIELAMHNMVPTLPSYRSPPLAVRLNILREREHAWRQLKWQKTLMLDLPKTGSVYEFVGGVYGNGKEDERMVAASIAFFQLPSSDSTLHSGDPPSAWTHSMDDLSIIDFTMDPAQDLLVLVALSPPDSEHALGLHLRTLSTNEPHPKAPMPTLFSISKGLPQDVDIIHAGTSVRVQIAGNLIALLCKEILDDIGAHVEIWNWRVNPRNKCTMSRLSGIDDFCFLSHDTFLVVTPGTFEVCYFQDPALFSSIPLWVASYALPTLSAGYIYWCVSMSGNPVPGYMYCSLEPETEEKDSELTAVPPMYQPRLDQRIHACTVYLFNPDQLGVINGFVFFVNTNTFLNPHRHYPSPPAPIPWEMWGPPNTRWFPEHLSTDWEHALYGCRTLDTVPCDTDDVNENEGDGTEKVRKSRLRVRDFNPYAIRRCMRTGQADQVVLEASKTCTNGAFNIDVVSWLPYTEVISEEAFDVTDVMMDDSRILLLKRSPSGELCEIKVLTV